MSHANVWGYSYTDIAKLTNKEINTVVQAASRGRTGRAPGFDPADFRSTVLWIFRNSSDEFRFDIMESMGFFLDPNAARKKLTAMLNRRRRANASKASK